MISPATVLVLLRHQLRYVKGVLVLGWLALACAGVGLSLAADSVRLLGKGWAMLMLLAGMGLTLHSWVTDIRERRVLGWLALPVTPATAVAARLAVPFVIHALILLPFLFSFPLWLGGAGMDARGVLEKVLSLHAFSLAMSIAIYLSEELTVLVYRWGLVGVIALNVVFVGIILAITVLGDRLGLPDIDEAPMLYVSYAAALAFGLLTLWLYRRRMNYLLGVDACTSMPVDWSSARG